MKTKFSGLLFLISIFTMNSFAFAYEGDDRGRWEHERHEQHERRERWEHHRDRDRDDWRGGYYAPTARVSCSAQDRWGRHFFAEGFNPPEVQVRARVICQQSTYQACWDLGCSRIW